MSVMGRLSWQWLTVILAAAILVAVVCARMLWQRSRDAWPW